MKNSQKSKRQTPEQLLPAQRMREPRVFKFVFENGSFAKGSFLRVWSYQDAENRFSGEGPKIGIVVSRKTSGSAVVRNRWKRRIRESFRKLQVKIKPETLVIISSRQGAKTVPALEQINAEIRKLLEKTGSLKS